MTDKFSEPHRGLVKSTDPDQPEIRKILEERGERYGEFADHAQITQALFRVLSGQSYLFTTLHDCSFRRSKWHGLSDDQRQALTVIIDKIARALNGDPTYADNWVDIAGYATLVADRLKKDYPQP